MTGRNVTSSRSVPANELAFVLVPSLVTGNVIRNFIVALNLASFFVEIFIIWNFFRRRNILAL